MSCCRRKARQDYTKVEGRRVLPNLLTRELFSKIDFYKYANNEEDTRKEYWWRNRARVKSNSGAQRAE